MARETGRQKKKIEEVLHEFKESELKQKSGRKVTDHKQAVAIALSEAGVSRQQKSVGTSAKGQRKSDTKWRGKQANTSKTRAELYREATRRGLAGRSRMAKQELAKALAR